MEFLHKSLGTIPVSGIRRKGAYTVERHSDRGQSFLTGIMGYEPLRYFEKQKVMDSTQNNNHAYCHTAPSGTYRFTVFFLFLNKTNTNFLINCTNFEEKKSYWI